MINNEDIKTEQNTKKSTIDKLVIPDTVTEIKAYEFSNYPNLKEVIISNNVTTISDGAFYNCQNLVAVKLPNGLTSIGKEAFKDCTSLKYIKFPETLEVIENDAFRNCSSLPKIYIPANLKKIGSGAFHKTTSCEKIEISIYNKKYKVFNNIALINEIPKSELILYAGGAKNQSFDLTKYCVYEINGSEVITEIAAIGQYALCGNPYLKKLILPSCTSLYERTAFEDCHNLKELEINGISFFPNYNIRIQDDGWLLYHDDDKDDTIYPFEHLTIKGPIYEISNIISSRPFRNLKVLDIKATYSYTIKQNAFNACDKLKVYLNSEVTSIEKEAFNKNATLIFSDNKTMKNVKSLRKHNEQLGTYTLYNLYDKRDDEYLIEHNDKRTYVSKRQIDEMCKNTEVIDSHPTTFLDFLCDMSNHNVDAKFLLNGVIIKNASIEARKKLFDICSKKDHFSKDVLGKSKLFASDDEMNRFLLSSGFERVMNYINILKENNITDEIFYDRLFMSTSKYVDYDYLFKNHYEKLLTIIKSNNFTDYKVYTSKYGYHENVQYFLTENTGKLTGNKTLDKIFYDDNLTKFIKLIDFLNIKNKIVFDETIIQLMDNILMIKFLIMLDKNLVRLLKASKVLENKKTATQNLTDLLNLLHITGALDTNQINRQKSCTFITEKVFADTLPNGKINDNQIIGDNIHRMLAFNSVKSYEDKEFSTLFLENYSKLCELEKSTSGTINDIYENFEEISETSTSDKGMQRKLKVTVEKCIHYLSNKQFENVPDGLENLAFTIGKWFTSEEAWQIAIQVHNESLNAPRNIFTKITLKDDGVIYDNDESNDLREDISPNYSYEWLPKQSYDNLLLGKYCNCCSHINGMGQGIMRASIISEDCQNLIVRNELGEIISKATIYVDRKQGYAIFNTVETKITYKNPKDLEKIYNAIMRGTTAFVDTYNQNNPYNKINTVTVGTKGNSLNNILENNETTDAYTYRPPLYGRYSITERFTYNGDCQGEQKILLKRK